MNETFEPEDGLIARLRALGQMPVDSATQARHLTAMAEAAAAPTLFGTFGNRVRVAVALVVGFLLGTTGLASAGALGPLQPIASTTLEKVGINVPHPDDAGTARYRGEECEDVSYKNRGSYLKAIRAKYGKDSAELEAAKASRCGMPLASEGDDVDGDGDVDAESTESESRKPEDKGKPETPGKSDEKGNSTDRSANADKAGKANKGAADDDATESDDGTEAPAGPAEGKKGGNAPEDPSADRRASDDASSDDPSSEADDVDEDETQDTPAPEQVPSEADTSSEGS